MASPARAPIVQTVPQPKVTSEWRTRAAWIGMLLVLAIAVAALHSFYRFGINETDDSAVYLSAAESPIQGARLTSNVGEPAGTPLTHYPPLYPILLMLGKEVSGSFLHAAAVIDFAAYLASCLAVYWFVRRYAPREWAFAAVALVLCSASIYYVHSLVSPDGPAIALMLAAMCFAADYVRRPKDNVEARRPSALRAIGSQTRVYNAANVVREYLLKPDNRSLILCGLSLAAAILLRYVSAAFIAAACLTVLLCDRAPWKRKLRSALLLGATACAPLACLLLVNALLGGNATDRTAHLHLVTKSALTDLVDTLSAFFLPYRLPWWFRALGLLAAALAMARIAVVTVRFGEAVRIAGAFLSIYLAFLLVSMSLFDAATPFDERILAPVMPLMCILFALVCGSLWERGHWPGKVLAAALLLIAMTVGATHAYGFLKVSAQARSTASLRRQYSALLPVIDALPRNAAIFSNVPFDLYLATGRNARTIPRVVGYTDLKPLSRQEIDSHLRAMRDEVARTGGLVIYKLRPPTLWDAGLLPQPELEKRVPGLYRLPAPRPFVLYGIQQTASVALN